MKKSKTLKLSVCWIIIAALLFSLSAVAVYANGDSGDGGGDSSGDVNGDSSGDGGDISGDGGDTSGGSDVPFDPAQKLLIHYDFAGATFADQLSDKAGDVKTNLSAVKDGFLVEADGTVPAGSVLAEDTAKTIFTFENGTVKSIRTGNSVGALVTGVTDDTKAIQTAETSGTWYLRLQLPDTTNGCIPLNFRKSPNNNRPLYLYYSAAKKLDVIIGTSSGPQTTTTGAMEIAATDWVNLAIVRAYNADTAKYDYTVQYKIDGDGTAWVTLVTVSYNSVVSSDDVVLALFAECCNQKDSKSAGLVAGIVYDDLRYYTDALTTDNLDAVIAAVTAPATPDGGDTNPDGGVTDPGDGGVTDPGDGGVTDPGDGSVTDPGDGSVTDPGDGDTNSGNGGSSNGNTDSNTGNTTQGGNDNNTQPDETESATESATEVPADEAEGCKSSIMAAGALMSVLLTAGAVMVCKKKH